jgi:hypothetical protein
LRIFLNPGKIGLLYCYVRLSGFSKIAGIHAPKTSIRFDMNSINQGSRHAATSQSNPIRKRVQRQSYTRPHLYSRNQLRRDCFWLKNQPIGADRAHWSEAIGAQSQLGSSGGIVGQLIEQYQLERDTKLAELDAIERRLQELEALAAAMTGFPTELSS